MRFDDRLITVLKGQLPEGSAAALQWRQVADLMAQKPGQLVNEDVQAGLTRLRDLHNRVNESDRLAAVEALNGRLRSAPLLVYLCADSDAICESAINAADLKDSEWADLIPGLPPNAKAMIKSRVNLGSLSRSAPSRDPDQDILVLSDEQIREGNIDSDPLSESTQSSESESEIPEPETVEQSQISNLVAKIADYQRDRSVETPRLPLGDQQHRSLFIEPVDTVQFETDDSGTINWVEGPPPGSVVGVTIAEPTFDDGPGPDAYGAAAFRQRMPLENARMRLSGASVVSGNWRMTAIPYFSEETGRFKGYRGIMRRPNAAEDAAHAGVDTERREQLQQLIHELRTPLNAIIGFSEIIEQQLFGPASFEYRTLSRNIMDEARRLLTGFEDLDIAAKIDAGQLESIPGSTDPTWLLERLTQRLSTLTQSKSVELRINKAEPIRAFALGGETVERVFARLLSATIIACEEGEELNAELRTRIGANPVNQFNISRPKRMVGISEDQLLDPSQGIDGDSSDAPLLGLGFSLRLVRNLAQSAAGSLSISDDRIGLTLPAVTTSELNIRETEIE
ncbi:MAG: hypothetical protein Pars2KO_30120 [Parasphingorhabdus sp.]